MKKNTESTKKKVYSLKEILELEGRSPSFKAEYDKELAQLRLARQIREARVAKKLTQRAVAEKAGMPQSVIARAESGVYGISVDTLERIASVFGKKVQII